MSSEQVMDGYRDLIAWQKAMDIVTDIYRVTRAFPKDELYGLVSQLRRAAVSIPSNLAEGYGRNPTREFHHFIGNARGSLLELETQIELASRLGFLDNETYAALASKTDELTRVITGLRSWSANASYRSAVDLLLRVYGQLQLMRATCYSLLTTEP